MRFVSLACMGMVICASYGVALPQSLAQSRLDQTSLVTLYGIGPLKAGMTVAEAERAIGDKMISNPKEEPEDPGDCRYLYPKNGPGGVAFMVSQGRIVRVDIEKSAWQTRSGAHIGNTEEEVKKRYPANIEVRQHPYGDDTDHYLVLTPKDRVDKPYLLIFETMGGKVTTLRSGLAEYVELIEGCS